MSNVDLYLAREAKKYGMTELYDLYSMISNDNLRKILSYLHVGLNHWFATINSDLRSEYDDEGNKVYIGGYFHAQDSRDLLQIFDVLDHLKRKLHNTPYEFEISNDGYDAAIRRCKRFVAKSGGSSIPEGFGPIEIEDMDPIFKIKTNIIIEKNGCMVNAERKYIGEGSYAKVFCYIDPTYQIRIAQKEAKKDLDNKEMSRFRQEFEVLKSLNSPYIVKVYSYDERINCYTMEYMDENIFDFIQRCNSELSLYKRKGIIYQICRGLEYMHSKNILHRDISLSNIFVKHYEDVDVFKIGDFGLVKIQESNLTSMYSEMKGSLNDPDLINLGFSNYEMCHETYALTRLCFFILTGKTNVTKQKDGMIKEFWRKGTSTNCSERFQNVKELQSFVQKINEDNK